MNPIKFIALLALGAGSIFAQSGHTALFDFPFPSEVAGSPWYQITNYAHDGSPGGVGASYRSTRLRVDIYVHEAGDVAWLDKPLAARFEHEIQQVPVLMQEMERRQLYRDVKVSEAEEVAAGSLKFRCVRIAYTEKDVKRISRYYLAIYRDRLLKIRITGEASLGEEPLDLAFREAVTPFQ